jgi:hypothetical protein
VVPVHPVQHRPVHGHVGEVVRNVLQNDKGDNAK